MELELKHLAPYLPYGLKIKILNHKCDYVGIEFSEFSGYYFLGESLHVSYNGGSTGKSIDDFKPILRPLSDILKEEDFLGIQNLIRVHIGKSKLQKMCADGYGLIDLPYFIVEQLLEHNFDVFGLIEQGLAIDINDC